MMSPSTIQQPWVIRLAHWLNVPLLVVMAGSGLQIFVAYPFLGPRGADYPWFPFQGLAIPGWLRLGDWLAGARALHFAFAWFFLLNGLVYLAFLLGSGEWRRRMFSLRRDSRPALHALLYYLRLRREAPPADPYNGLQRFAYSSSLFLGALVVLSGLAIWKPVQLAPLASLFGGYDGARVVHLLALLALAIFTAVHVVMVLLHPRSLRPMITGTSDDGRSPAPQA